MACAQAPTAGLAERQCRGAGVRRGSPGCRVKQVPMERSGHLRHVSVNVPGGLSGRANALIALRYLVSSPGGPEGRFSLRALRRSGSGSASDAEEIAGIRIESVADGLTRASFPLRSWDRELGGDGAGRVRGAFASRPWQRALIVERLLGPLPLPSSPFPRPGPCPCPGQHRTGDGRRGRALLSLKKASMGVRERPRAVRARRRAPPRELYAVRCGAGVKWSTGAGRALMGRSPAGGRG